MTLLELLVQPYRDQKDELAQKIFALTSTYPQIQWVPLTMNLADRAAELRAHYRLSTPDAITVGDGYRKQSRAVLRERSWPAPSRGDRMHSCGGPHLASRYFLLALNQI